MGSNNKTGTGSNEKLNIREKRKKHLDSLIQEL